MCSAILSDTLMFRSPTCTALDERAARELAAIAGVDVEELASAMFEAGSDFGSKTISEIFYQDFKTFVAEEDTFGVAQISAVSEKQLSAIKGDLQTYMPIVLGEKGLKMCFVMLTNILTESTELLYEGKKARETVRKAFSEAEFTGDSFLLPGVVSRKKQLIPSLIDAMQED